MTKVDVDTMNTDYGREVDSLSAPKGEVRSEIDRTKTLSMRLSKVSLEIKEALKDVLPKESEHASEEEKLKSRNSRTIKLAQDLEVVNDEVEKTVNVLEALIEKINF